MTERPGAMLGLLLAATAAAGAAVAAGLMALGAAGLSSMLGNVLGVFSMCVFAVAEADRLSVAALVPSTIVLASSISFLRAVVAYRREQGVLRRLPLMNLPRGELARIAAQADVAVYLSPARRPAAFCFGLLRPKVVLTAGLLAELDDEEQAAALLHEIQHARVREPLRCLAGHLAVSTFFWLPVLRDVFERYLLVKEMAADRYAVARTSCAALVGALSAVAEQPSPPAAVGLAELAGARVGRLFEPTVSLPRLWHVRRLIISAGAALTLSLPLVLTDAADLHAAWLSPSFYGVRGVTPPYLCNVALLAVALALGARAWRTRSQRA